MIFRNKLILIDLLVLQKLNALKEQNTTISKIAIFQALTQIN